MWQGSNVLTVSNLGDSRCVLGTVRADSGFLEVSARVGSEDGSFVYIIKM